jgi:hypothetical protein
MRCFDGAAPSAVRAACTLRLAVVGCCSRSRGQHGVEALHACRPVIAWLCGGEMAGRQPACWHFMGHDTKVDNVTILDAAWSWCGCRCRVLSPAPQVSHPAAAHACLLSARPDQGADSRAAQHRQHKAVTLCWLVPWASALAQVRQRHQCWAKARICCPGHRDRGLCRARLSLSSDWCRI